jgi:CDP-diacylglycerol--serine O-phosphatidyltransferase
MENEIDKPRPKRFSMIREFQFADWFTLANAVCGTGAVLASMAYLQTGDVARLYAACGAILAALVFDVLDGRIARWRQTSSALGRELDSLADVISFGVAPAVLGFTLGLRGFWDAIVLCVFVCCGIARLARYNVTAATLADDSGKVRYYEGTPIPTSVGIVAFLAFAWWQGAVGDHHLWLGRWRLGIGHFHPLVLVYALSGALMISRFRIPKP